MTLLEQYRCLDLDGSLIGLEKGSETGDSFCTPIGMTVLGWENSIHYGFIHGYGEMVFAVNPESCADRYVYPLAKNFEDFLRLLLACGSTTAMEQIICWEREQYEAFLRDDPAPQGRKELLERLTAELKLRPMSEPFDYVKELQAVFDSSLLRYSNEYYDTLGLERPDGTEPDSQETEFIN